MEIDEKMDISKNSNPTFVAGEVYLFRNQHNLSIIGVFDKCENGQVMLESATYTTNYREFYFRYVLPDEYKYWRRASRPELRDYMYNLGVYETKLLCSRMMVHKA